MPKQTAGFQSRSEREREEALCCHYRSIGIPAVAAAKSALRHKQRGDESTTDRAARSTLRAARQQN